MDATHNENHDNLHGAAAVDKIRDVIDKTDACFFCTSIVMTGSSGSRPMAVRQVDDEGNLWFLSPIDSNKNDEIKIDPNVRLYFHASSHSYFLELNGYATITQDRAKIEELWEPLLKTWFTEGKDDPRITAIKVTPIDGYYWNTKHGNIVAGAKMLMGAVTGKQMDDGVEGRLNI